MSEWHFLVEWLMSCEEERTAFATSEINMGRWNLAADAGLTKKPGWMNVLNDGLNYTNDLLE